MRPTHRPPGTNAPGNSVLAAAILSLAFIFSSTALAESDLRDLIRNWGLVGRWATDCALEAIPHGVVSYEIEPDGRTIIDSGPTIVELKIVKITMDGDLVLQTIATNAADEKVLMLRRTDAALRPVVDGTNLNSLTHRNGKFVASLRETSPLKRCGSRTH
jgi:hypothetical protein